MSEQQANDTTTSPRHSVAPEDRIPLRSKVVYGMGVAGDMWGHWLYPTIAFQIFGLALHVPGKLIGIAVLLNRIFDAFSDPIFGWLSDNTRTRMGRRRPFMLVASFAGGIGLPFLLTAAIKGVVAIG